MLTERLQFTERERFRQAAERQVQHVDVGAHRAHCLVDERGVVEGQRRCDRLVHAAPGECFDALAGAEVGRVGRDQPPIDDAQCPGRTRIALGPAHRAQLAQQRQRCAQALGGHALRGGFERGIEIHPQHPAGQRPATGMRRLGAPGEQDLQRAFAHREDRELESREGHRMDRGSGCGSHSG